VCHVEDVDPLRDDEFEDALAEQLACRHGRNRPDAGDLAQLAVLGFTPDQSLEVESQQSEERGPRSLTVLVAFPVCEGDERVERVRCPFLAVAFGARLRERLVDESIRLGFEARPVSEVPRAARFQAPSPSVQVRTRRCMLMRRRVLPGSGSAAARVRSASSRSSFTDARPASDRSRCSAFGFAAAPSTTAAACSRDRRPSRIATASVSSARTSEATLACPARTTATSIMCRS
jgi:hypothetical protein